MSKRLVIFCSDLINEAGPLSADDLSQPALAAGLTKAVNPVLSIRTALRQSPVMVQLADGRFDSARRMLNGAALTHRVRFATKGKQILYAGPELAVLDQILVHEGSLALTTGGAITSSLGEFGGWCGPADWLPDVPADTLLEFRFRNGRLTVTPLADEPSPKSDEIERLRAVLRRYLMSSDNLDDWRSHHTLGKVMLRALAELPDLLADPLPPLDEVLHLGRQRWAREWPVESADGPTKGQLLVLEDVPGALVSALQHDAHRLGVTTAELTVLLLSAATYRTAMPCRHDAQDAWLSSPPPDYPDAYNYTPNPEPDPDESKPPTANANAPARPDEKEPSAPDPTADPNDEPGTPDATADPQDPDGTASKLVKEASHPSPTYGTPPSSIDGIAITPDNAEETSSGDAENTSSGDADKLQGSDDCEPSDEFEEVWIDDLPDAVLALKRPPE
jgi:hypothetical protein